jgi:hypothetical protein
MNSNFTTGFNKPSIFTAQTYGTKTTVEVDHSDLSLDEVMDAFQTLIIGMGYHENSFKNWVTERAVEYNETDAEDLKEKLEAWKFEDDDNDIRHRYLKDSEGYESMDELENDFFGPEEERNIDAVEEMRKYAEGEMEKAISYEEWHRNRDKMAESTYRATEEDEDEFSNDGGFDGKPHFEWGDEPEDDGDLFEGDSWVANEKLVEANERYKSEVKKKMNSKKRNNKA